MTGPAWAFGRVDAARTWADLARAEVNYSPAEVRPPGWHFDTHRTRLPAERPGAPEPGGPWERACGLVRDYQFSPPEIVRAIYDATAPLHGRDMLLEARFHGLHFYCGVRVTEVVDSDDGERRVSGWGYQTLRGHLERGKVTYQVVKHRATGEVEFVASSHSQVAPTLGPVVHLGWRLFGRRTQLRFYRRCGQRLHDLVAEGTTAQERLAAAPRVEHLMVAPADARLRKTDTLAFHRVSPGLARDAA